MKQGWPEVPLGDVIDIFDHLRVPLNATQRAARQGPFPYYGAQGVIDHVDGYLFDGRYLLIPEDGENLNSRKLPIAYFASGRFWVNNHAHIVRGKPGVADDVFLKQWLNNADIGPFVTGAAQPKLSQGSLKRIPVRLPPLAVQRRIASILGAYDDLIEVNRRRIAVLEEMARRLFEEWFVHFRFPGHAGTAAAADSLPRGWRRGKLADAAAINGAAVRPADAPDRIGYIDIASVSPGTIENVAWMSFESAPGRARRRVKDGSVIWSMVRPNRRSFALVLDPEPDTIASTGFAVLDAKTVPMAYLYQWVTQDSFVAYLSANATGAAYPAVTATVFERADIVLPPADLMRRFAALAEPQLRLAGKLKVSNSVLAGSRDLLLPRLISGDLPVAAAERELEAVA